MAAVRAVSESCKMERQYHARYGVFASLQQLSATGEVRSVWLKHLIAGGDEGYSYGSYVETDRFSLTAVPRVFGETGRRSFYCDETGILRQNWTGVAGASSEPLR